MNVPLTPVQRFWRLIKPDQKEIQNVYIYAIFYGLVTLTLPIGIQAIINLIQGGTLSTSWIVLVAFVILGIAITGILQISQLRITEYLQQKIFARAAFEFAYRIPRFRLEAMHGFYTPELMNRFFDVISIQKGLSKLLVDFSTASIQTIFGLILLSLYHPFFIIFSLILVFLIFVIFKITAKKGLQTSLQESESKYRVAHWLEELARTGLSFKLAGETELPMERIDKAVNSYVENRESHFKVLVSQYKLLVFFKVCVAAGLLIMGSLLVMEQQMNIGQFVAAEIIILLILGSVEKIILSLENIYDVLAALEKVGQVTDLELERETGSDLIANTEDGLSVSFKDIYFTYPGQSTPIFQGINLEVLANDRLVIFGQSNSGKTTLLHLMAGLYKVQQGSICYDNLPFGNLNPHKLRSSIGDCFMDELLFEGTLLENITMGREKATFENVQWAIQNLGLTEFVKSLPNGYNTIINPLGKEFSKGIVDKLILARGIADKPKLLLVRDVFSHFSKEEKDNIFSFLSDKSNKWTLIITTNDPYLTEKYDRTIEVVNGQLISN